MKKKSPSGSEDPKAAMMRERRELINEVDPVALKITHRAWNQSRANTFIKKDKSGAEFEVQWKALTLRDKQKASVDWLGGVVMSPEMQYALVKDAMADPQIRLSLYKMHYSMMPKEIDISTSAEVGVVILPGKVGNVAQWMEMAKGVKDIDGEVVGEVGADAAQTWKNILEKQ